MSENKYKAKYWYGTSNSTLMNPNDIILIDDDKCYNVTRGLDFSVGDPIEFKNTYLTNYGNTDFIIAPSIAYLREENTKNENNIRRLFDDMYQTYIRKNHDYGNSFDKSLDEEGIAAARIRMGDKWNRFKQLSKGNDALVKDESIRDTLLDLALYCVMTVNWYDSQKV